MMRRFAFYIFILLLIQSCSRNDFYVLSVQPIDDNTLEDGYVRCKDKEYDLDIAFAEDALGYLIFNAELTSYSKDSIGLDSRQFHVDFIHSDGDLIQYDAIEVQDILSALDSEKTSIKKEKKTRTTWNAIITGVEVLSIALAPGGNAVGAIAYGAESALYIADERNAYRVAELSIEDEIKYLNDQVLDRLVIPPYEKVNFDILFERNLEDNDFSILFERENGECAFDFNQEMIKG